MTQNDIITSYPRLFEDPYALGLKTLRQPPLLRPDNCKLIGTMSVGTSIERCN